MQKLAFVVAAVLGAAACHGSDPTTGTTGSATTPAPGKTAGSDATGSAPAPSDPGAGSAIAAGSGSGSAAAVAPPATPPTPPAPAIDETKLEGHDFTPDAKVLLAVGACGDAPIPPAFDAKLIAAHCDAIKKTQDDYVAAWMTPATKWFAEHVPHDIPKTVVYPFAGGDLSTALTVYPDADEITTMSLEPAGDPRTIYALKGGDLKKALGTIEFELHFLYHVNFSNTINMIDAMRSGKLPTNLTFSLSAMKIHGYEVVGMRYFNFNEDGTLHYLTDDDVAHAPPIGAKAEQRNAVFSNVELHFRKPGGRIQIYRHVRQNLDNEHLKGKDARVLKYLEARGEKIAMMTKAASYLLSWESFSVMRNFILGHAVWMVSDATGVAPQWGKPAGFEYETYGGFKRAHIPAGGGIEKDWRVEFESEPKRDLPFRFGYYDKSSTNHLIIMRKK